VTYSLENLVFRAVGCAVNTAARAANTVLTVMYPPDIGHIWDSPREGVEAAPAEAAGADDAAADTSVPPPVSAAGSLNLPWEVIELRSAGTGFRWRIADRWGVIIGTEDQAYAVVEAVSANTLAGGPLLW
jgi:hypothetical protein